MVQKGCGVEGRRTLLNRVELCRITTLKVSVRFPVFHEQQFYLCLVIKATKVFERDDNKCKYPSRGRGHSLEFPL